MGTIAEMSMYTAAFGALIGTMTVAIGEIGMSLERAKTENPDPYRRPGQKKQGRERKEKRNKTDGKTVLISQHDHYQNIHQGEPIENTEIRGK